MVVSESALRSSASAASGSHGPVVRCEVPISERAAAGAAAAHAAEERGLDVGAVTNAERPEEDGREEDSDGAVAGAGAK